MSNLDRSTFTFPKASKPTERVKPMESSMNKQSPVSIEDEVKFWHEFERLALLVRSSSDDSFDINLDNLVVFTKSRVTRNSVVLALAQKKYQEGELKGRIAEQDDWVKPWTENAVEWEQDGEGSGIQYFDSERLDRYRQLKSQLEKEEQ